MKILFLTNYPSPYRVDFFNELGNRKEIDLTVVFQEYPSEQKHRSPDWFHDNYDCFKAIFLERRITLPRNYYICPEINKVIKKGYDIIIIGGINSPTAMFAMEYMKLHHITYWIEGDGAFAKSGKGLKEKIKRHFISGAGGYFSTSKAHDEYYITYGAELNKIHRYPFTSIREEYVLANPIGEEEKTRLRVELGMTEKPVVISVGQMIPRKGFDVLIRAAAQCKEVDFYIIGGTSPQEYTELKQELCAKNVQFVDFKKPQELRRYYQAADLFVLPTREDIWGLVINEAMANGLPVITTDRCVAGLELVRNGENGYIVPVGDVEGTTEAIRRTLSDDTYKMGKRSLEIIRDYTIEKMVDAHVEAFYRKNEKD